MPTRKFQVNEGNNYDLELYLSEDTTGETISVRLVEKSTSGAGASVGSSSGGEAYSKITIQLGIKTYSPNEYKMEVWADYGGSNQRIVSPKPKTDYILKIKDRFAVSN
jgi:hypothetical protein